ncbi:YeiH family protein [Bradyrhizobium sp. AUGA SZCCT0042]|uniref:YeiH family protein n=1 Tax=Bradyrhizobium sp. AUGA SZCCT0042 TaxID=2807651 RepID=UPI001BADC097|nr:putative sulfate exporter family transporter [Bradyrhizobium sp. AUGA SZCCT0042]MBR1301271.1 putative sulfate exporter family transporter [Bradyrhizobium sp. AUGA SZCCT0042]
MIKLSTIWPAWREPARTNFPGILMAVVVATAAMSLAEHYHASAMLFALLLGMAMNFLSTEGACVQGIQFSASTLLRIGVALLGVRITFAQITALGLLPIAMVVLSVALTIGFGILLARLLGYRNRFGVLTGGAVAICGASAAMAIAAVMPAHAEDNVKERATIFTVIGVSTLSTVAMVVYPIIVTALGLGHEQAGVFLGGTIHDVAQVVGAGYGMSRETGDVATIVKLLRVAMLLPVILIITLSYRKLHVAGPSGTSLPPVVPWFVAVFALLVAINSSGLIPASIQQSLQTLSTWLLVVSMSAIGMKAHLKDFATVGFRPILLMVSETVFLAILVIAFIFLAR